MVRGVSLLIFLNLKHIGSQVQLRFRISQHDRSLLDLIRQYLSCGTIQTSSKTKEFIVTSNKDIVNFIIPFFNKYPLLFTPALLKYAGGWA